MAIRGYKWLLSAVALAFLMAFVLRLENKMMLQVQMLLAESQMIASLTGDRVTSAFSTTSTSASPLPPPPSTDWFQEEAWYKNRFTKECWHVENICHSSHRWFYDPRSLRPDRQPSFSLSVYEPDATALRIKGHPTSSSSTSSFLGRPKKLIINAPQQPNVTYDFVMNGENSSTSRFLQTCKYSPIPNHMVLQSFFNDMLGEFYARSLTYIYKMYDIITKSTAVNNNSTGLDSLTQDRDYDADSTFPEQTQMYLHVRNFPEYAKLLDSHHVFTDAFRSNALLSFNYLIDYTGCRCLKRLLLCGYDDANNQKVRGFVANKDESVMTELVPSGNSGINYIQRDQPIIFRESREQLRRNVIQRNPFMQQDITKFRADAIARHRPKLTKLTAQQISEFRIVGLTQRTGRRRWLNLDEIIKKCNTKWFSNSENIVCVEINLENDDVNPVRQVVIHAACDMLFGIHGAQLTEAVWMKDGSVVVELLPWIPDGALYGKWTRTTDSPTPLGLVFGESQLNHIGYPLQRDSAPFCLDKKTPDALKKCFSLHLWDVRDFQVNPDAIRDMIDKFVPKLSGSETDIMPVTTCEELEEKAGDQVYVLYNVVCAHRKRKGKPQEDPTVHHFYWPKDWNLTLAFFKSGK
jgi:hypothetical protein